MIYKIIPTVDNDGSFDSWDHVALQKLTWSMLVNSLGYDNDFDCREWNDDFRSNFNPFLHTPPNENRFIKKIYHLQTLHRLLSETNFLQAIHLIYLLLHIILFPLPI